VTNLSTEDRLFLHRLGVLLRTQDGMDDPRGPSHATAHPIYMVQERERIYGIDSSHQDPDGYEEDEFTTGPVPYVERWVFVQGAVSLTREGIEAYLAVNRHNLRKPRIYVASMTRCREMQQLVEIIERANWMAVPQ
jgi:hypothetical protein